MNGNKKQDNPKDSTGFSQARKGADTKLFLSFILKESRHILRDKRTMLVLFGMPVVLMLLFGFAISTEVKNVRTVIVTASMDNQTQKLVNALDASEYFIVTSQVGTPSEAERLKRNQEADIAVVFAPDFASRQSGLQIITDGADPNMAQQYSNYAAMTMAQHIGRETDTLASPSVVNTKLLYNPQMKSAYNFVPGIMGILLMLICAMMTSISIVKEKERGTMEVLLVSPVRPLMIIIAKAIPYMALAFAILVTILIMARFALHVPITGSLFWIIIVSTIYIVMALSLGLLISTIAKTQLTALLVSAMVLMMPSLLLSGMIYPIESMPPLLQWVSAAMPPRYYISAMRKLMIMGVDIGSVLQELAVLTVMTVVFLTVALKKFKVRL